MNGNVVNKMREERTMSSRRREALRRIEVLVAIEHPSAEDLGDAHEMCVHADEYGLEYGDIVGLEDMFGRHADAGTIVRPNGHVAQHRIPWVPGGHCR